MGLVEAEGNHRLTRLTKSAVIMAVAGGTPAFPKASRSATRSLIPEKQALQGNRMKPP
jgi:hypothetical protein